MKERPNFSTRNEKGIALVTTLMLSLLLSIIVGGMLLASTSDTQINGNDVRNNQAFYIAEAGINRASGWFTAKFGIDPNLGLYVLPEKYLDSDPNSMMGSNTTGAVGKLSYTTGEPNFRGVAEPNPYYKAGAVSSYTEQTMPTSVKTLVSGNLQNVVIAGDSTNTYPNNYTVSSVNSSGTATTFNYANVVTDFTNNLVNQTEGEGTFTVKAILISILPPPDNTQNGTITWLLQSTGRLTRGNNSTIASTTLWAYLSAHIYRVQGVRTVMSGTQVVNADPGVVARGMVAVNANSVAIDSYKSSKGLYGISLTAGSYAGQIGAYNIGSRGDVRTNNETINGVQGYINISNGIVTGNGYATFPPPSNGAQDPIFIDPTKVMYTMSPAVPFDATHKYYSQPALTFPDIAPIPTPAANSVDYSYSKSGSATLPTGNYKDISISKGILTVPPGTYGTMNLSAQGQVVLGTPGQTTTYNFQGFVSGAQTTIIYRGPVVINVQSSLDLGGQGNTADLTTPASALHWNFKGGNGEVVSLGGGSNTLGVFYAPNNSLQIKGNGPFYGAIAAKNVDINGTGAIHIDQDALLPVTMTIQVTQTAQIIVGYTASNYSLWRITEEID